MRILHFNLKRFIRILAAKEKKNLTVLQRGNSYISTGGRFNGIYFESEYKQLGSFSIMVDDTPPSIIPIVYKPNMSKSKFIKFKIQDNVPALGKAKELKYNAYIDGQWILMEHDEKTNPSLHYIQAILHLISLLQIKQANS